MKQCNDKITLFTTHKTWKRNIWKHINLLRFAKITLPFL